ncbi:hypothetical protein LMG23992_02315 [Cupriavidus laharis]|uniref:Uncharacterized protein n=1 Tax=Cupriavidus laharis TaxID=151654 RepID=A0ABM8WYU9_9BURK|nr:hypothetical protein [Cupriavidus laharis]CAG9172744.1 hypothetical protein LMG23992_02315 [Cupriavidus laharis]
MTHADPMTFLRFVGVLVPILMVPFVWLAWRWSFAVSRFRDFPSFLFRNVP